MNINYYNSVTVINSQHREQGFSLTSMLYNCGDKLCKASGMYKGKSYSLYLYKDRADQIITEDKTTKHSCWEKIGAVVGRCLKEIAGFFDPKIKAKHLFVEELQKEKPDPFMLRDFSNIILKKNGDGKTEVTHGEGSGVAAVLGCGVCCVLGVIALVWGLVAKGGVAH